MESIEMKDSFVVLFSFCLTICMSVANGQQFDVFYLSVGNAHYVKDKDKIKQGSESFGDVNGARRSARYIHEVFTELANGKGILMRSEAGKLLTKAQILTSLDQVIRLAKKSKSKNPLIVFYYCGHGVSEGIAWSQFLVPGDFAEKPQNIDTDPVAIDLDELSDKLLYLGEITDKLANAGIPYLCLIDACYEGAEEKFSALDRVMSSKAIENIRDIAKILRYMNEYHDSNPVVFATAPGTTVHTVDDPTANKDSSRIGPLCRRLILVKDKLFDYDGELSLSDIVALLSDPQLDEVTSKAVSHYEFNDHGLKVLLKLNSK